MNKKHFTYLALCMVVAFAGGVTAAASHMQAHTHSGNGPKLIFFIFLLGLIASVVALLYTTHRPHSAQAEHKEEGESISVEARVFECKDEFEAMFAKRFVDRMFPARAYYKFTFAKLFIEQCNERVVFSESLASREAFMAREYKDLVTRIEGIIEEASKMTEDDWNNDTPDGQMLLDQLVAMMLYHDHLLQRCIGLGICCLNEE